MMIFLLTVGIIAISLCCTLIGWNYGFMAHKKITDEIFSKMKDDL
jgi:hypothetical protein